MHPIPSLGNIAPVKVAARNTVGLLVAIGLSACAASGGVACRSDEQQLVSETLYLGAATPDGVVESAEWAGFLEETVTSRFPDGLTVWQAFGKWRGADGRLVDEESHVLNLVHSGDAASEQKVDEISSEYKRRFQQEAVLRTRGLVCVSF